MSDFKKNKAELLLPAGDLRRLKTAILYGADAVYAGTPAFSLRSKVKFSTDELIEGKRLLHEKGKKLYLVLNIYSHNADIKRLPDFVKTLNAVEPDGVIIADPGVFNIIKKECPNLELHISTQANVCSYETVNFWKEQGADLVVLGREVGGAELKEIREKCKDVRLEYFIHGSLCMSYSGRCLLSNFMANRGANQGKCANSCRWKYNVSIKPKSEILEQGKDGLKEFVEKQNIELTPDMEKLFDYYLEEEQRKGEFMQIDEDSQGAYILNSRDLCLLPRLDQLLEMGIDSLKVEGRNKSEYYVGSVARAYRRAIDDWYKDPENWDYKKYMSEFHTVQYRGYTTGFFDSPAGMIAHNYETTRSTGVYRVAGFVRKVNSDHLVMEMRNDVSIGEELEFLSPVEFDPIKVEIENIVDAKNNKEIEGSKISAGHDRAMVIPFKWFEKQGIKSQDISNLFPELTLVRKKLNLSIDELEYMRNHSSEEPDLKMD